MEYIKSLTYQHYPLEDSENEEKEWKACVVAIEKPQQKKNNRYS